jgi:hypothetical protein
VPVPGQPPGTVHRKPQPCNPPKREAA